MRTTNSQALISNYKITPSFSFFCLIGDDMKLDVIVENFTPPPHPKSVVIDGTTVRLEPLSVEKHAKDLFAANAADSEGKNWTYLPYGPFENLDDYAVWLGAMAAGDDPTFFAIIRKSDGKAAGIASFLRISPQDGSIEVGHINFSNLLQRTIEGTESMYLMMKWAFENGYRRYEWKCNALNLKSRHAAQRLGLSYEGVFRQMTITKGRNRNTAWFAAIDKEWDAIKNCFEQYLLPENFDTDGKPKTSLSACTRPILYKKDDMILT